MTGYEFLDQAGRQVTLRAIDAGNWRDVADVAPVDDQRRFVAALAARYLLLSTWEDVWTSLAVYADDTVVGHLMWGRDDDGSYWLGGMVVDASQQGNGVGRAACRTMVRWLAAQEGCDVIRLSYHPDNAPAKRLYASLGFVPTGAVEDDEIVAELSVRGPASRDAEA